jgi:hypothetical protein
MDVRLAQDEMRAGFVLGAPGVLVSGLAWLAAGVVWAQAGVGPAFTVLFIGGIAIFPVSALMSRLVFRAPAVPKANPFNALGFETTVPLFGGLLAAFVLLKPMAPVGLALFAAIVGARYFAFATIYRERTYWALGATLFAAGYVYIRQPNALSSNVALCVGVIELAFAILLFVRWRSSSPA